MGNCKNEIILCLTSFWSLNWNKAAWFYFYYFAKKKVETSIVSVISCYVTNYHTFRDLKQCIFIISQYLWVRSLVMVLKCPQQGYSQGVGQAEVSSETPVGKDQVPSSRGCWQNWWFANCGTEDLRSLLPVGQMMSLSCGPLWGAPNPAACFFKTSKGEGFLARQMLRSYIMSSQKMIPLTFPLFYSFGSKSWSYSRGGSYTRTWRPGGGIMGSL